MALNYNFNFFKTFLSEFCIRLSVHLAVKTDFSASAMETLQEQLGRLYKFSFEPNYKVE